MEEGEAATVPRGHGNEPTADLASLICEKVADLLREHAVSQRTHERLLLERIHALDGESGELRGQVAALSQHLKAVDSKAGSKKARKKNRIESGLGIQSGDSPSIHGSSPADSSRRECARTVEQQFY